MPVFTSLFVPVDGSEPSDAATALALRLAADQKAALTFVNVIETNKILASVMPGQGFADPAPAIDALRAAGKQMLADAVSKAQTAGVKAASQLLEGDCVPCIVSMAQQSGADLIVIGSHGRGGLTRLVLGSVAEGVLRHCKTPVLIVKAPAA
ncbi:MAG: universal stress protein [Candidatus Eremiobacteraeota bacterium]|nr:universal stress protein [Candidatus Eremiobacteraeota bacterium]MBV8221820.1 universal stress protein [Candidatus Eremiobacteraeota bacterium]MBV8282567.1 universal stress protein [Candidatus Eremiobacteraeota bacterium]